MLPILGALTLLASLALQEGAGDDERAHWKELAARCGNELAWATDWDAASARARSEQKPVLVVAWLYPGFDIADGSRTVFAMDTDIIELVNERCVPLHLTLETRAALAQHVRYGLSESAFGSGLLLFAPDGALLADCAFLEPVAAYDFLCAALVALPEFGGAAAPKALPAEELALRHLARGELAAAAQLLAEPERARGFLAKARLLRRRHDGAGARAALQAARAHAPGELAPALALEALTLELSLANVPATRALCAELLDQHPEREEARAAEYVLGLLELAGGEGAAAETRWRALTREHADSRWARLAAAALLEPAAELASFRLVVPPVDLLATLATVPYAVPDEREAGAPAAEALRWLRALRRADGTWPDPSELGGGASASNAISVAVDVLAARALLAQDALERADVLREAGLALGAGRASLAQREQGPAYMTYEVWSDALMLELLADLLATEAKGLPVDELRALGGQLVAALEQRQRQNGGWSYFEAVSLEKDAAKLEQSISFVTASVVLALVRAHAAGIEFDEEVLSTGLDALEAFRSDEGVFAYMLWSFQRHADDEEVAGAAGRAPLCELALLDAGRSDVERLRAALEQFFAHAETLAQETGKSLMHCGADGQGCHYVLYDYATCARAIAALPASERKPYRERLLARLASARRADGAFLDTPVLGPASATALALLAFAELGRD